MPNLLRSPAVLFVLLLTVYWVFGPTTTGTNEKDELNSESNQDKLVLRVPLQKSKPDPPLPPAKTQRKGPPRATIRATEGHQLTSAANKPTTPEDSANSATTTLRAKLRGITPLPDRDPELADPVPKRTIDHQEPQFTTHQIVDGDDLRRLAAKYLGDTERFYEIFEANPDVLRRPDVLPVGQSIRIPLTE